MSSPSPSVPSVQPGEIALLFDIADASISRGLRGEKPNAADVSALPRGLQEKAGVFVTLTVSGALNGCMGSVEAAEPLGSAVARLAWSAAFADPRLPVLAPPDYADLNIEISILSPLAIVVAESRGELLGRVRPGVDGLLITAGSKRAVFLPSVWDQIPDPEDFLDRLQQKAGMVPGTWPEGIRAARFIVTKHRRSAGGGSVAG